MSFTPPSRCCLRRIVAVSVLIVGLALPASAEQVQLTWDPNSESDLAGYVVLTGTSSRVYTQSLEVGPGSPTATVAGLAAGATYYFAVRAFNSAGLQSGWSNEVVVTMPGTTPGPPPAPFAQAFSPVAGPITGGTVVTITGAHFAPGASVLFGAARASVTSVTATSVTVVTPAQSAGSVAVSIHNPDGKSAVAGGVFTYQATTEPPTGAPPTGTPPTGTPPTGAPPAEQPPAAPFVRCANSWRNSRRSRLAHVGSPESPLPKNASSSPTLGTADTTGRSAASCATSWSSVTPRRVASASSRLFASGERSIVTDMTRVYDGLPWSDRRRGHAPRATARCGRLRVIP